MPGATRAKKTGVGRPKLAGSGKLRIGDDWNAITIIALSQDNPLKAIAEFVENSIDAGAKNVLITRSRERGEHFLTVADDGDGVRKNEEGAPDFRYVATHICDSIKRQLKAGGLKGIQGEFGIGLLSFWTVGEALAMSAGGDDGSVHEMHMRKGDPGYEVTRRPVLAPEPGTRLKIGPLLPGVRQISGEKIQWYLASELRERIRHAGVHVRVIDRHARKEFRVEPRQFTGDLLHQLPAVSAPQGDAYVELYLNPPDAANAVGLYRSGTRILSSLGELDAFARSPWTDGYLQGIVDVPYLNLTPATRTGVIQDSALEAFATALAPLETRLLELIAEHRRAEEERMSRDTLRSIQRAFREALLTLPSEEYEWFDVSVRQRGGPGGESAAHADEASPEGIPVAVSGEEAASPRQKQFFEFAGPLHSVRIVPAACTLAVGTSRTFRALARDTNRRALESGVEFAWRIVEGSGQIDNATAEIISYTAPAEPCLTRLAVSARQGETLCEAEALVTVTDSFLPEEKSRSAERQGLPGYTLQHAPGKLWRSRFDAEQNVIVVNSGHRDYIYAARAKALKLRYLVRLYSKEMVQKNFPGLPSGELLDRLIELSLYTEENLR
jgi:Histidine kinase-, DNA gyrase B-, and HSP90-like ATPase